MRVAWLTDLHLNFLSASEIGTFLDNVREDEPDVVLISGDTGEARSLQELLGRIEARLQRPIYFVLGNHDFYYGSIHGVRAAVARQAQESRWLTWLTGGRIIPLTADTALIGHDSWADGRCGDYEHSDVLMNDYLLIEEFAGLNKRGRLDRLHALGDAAAAYFSTLLPLALMQHRRIILVTHVPPFQEACWHEGQISDDNFLPHFVCKAAGDAMRTVMAANPDRNLLVLCGHTHGEGEAQILPNLRVLTGGAEYGAPEVQRVFDLSRDG
jgi:3',5'-cyclic AMP phosphodiesterase CpdA